MRYLKESNPEIALNIEIIKLGEKQHAAKSRI